MSGILAIFSAIISPIIGFISRRLERKDTLRRELIELQKNHEKHLSDLSSAFTEGDSIRRDLLDRLQKSKSPGEIK